MLSYELKVFCNGNLYMKYVCGCNEYFGWFFKILESINMMVIVVMYVVMRLIKDVFCFMVWDEICDD